MKRLIAAIVGVSFFLGACSTMEGLGRDIQSGGQKLEDKAQDARR
jgi:predicted small secreted protein